MNKQIKEAFSFDGLNFPQRVGKSLYFILLIGYLVGLFYFLYFSNAFIEIGETIKLLDRNAPFVMIIFLLGLYFLSIIFYMIVEKLFYPLTKEEKQRKLLDKQIKLIEKKNNE